MITNHTGARRSRKVIRAALAVSVSLATLHTGVAAAQISEPAPDVASGGGLEEIVVTAQRREENLQKVPISIAAISADTLDNIGVDSTTEISQAIPAVQFTRSGPSGLFFIRGVGTTNGAFGEEGANAFYLDGVYMPDLSQTINSFNSIARIEVLKGPQGTLFGRNAFGGLVHVITRDPGDELVVRGEASLANYQTVAGKFYVGGPITDGLGLDIALTGQDQGRGWGRNVTTNRENKKQDYWGARSKLVYRPSDAFKLTFTGDYSTIDDTTALGWRLDDDYLGTAGQRSPGGHNASAERPQFFTQDTWGFGLTGEFDFGFATLTSVSAIRDNEATASLDVDAGPLTLLGLDYEAGSRAYQQELRLASNDTDPFSWQIGAFYLRSEAFTISSFSGGAFAPGGIRGRIIDVDLTTDSYAAFGEVTYAITPSTRLTGGIRFTKDQRRLSGGITPLPLAGGQGPVTPVSGKLSYDEITYRIALRQELSDDINVYASLNRGFKAGSYNLQAPTNPPVRPQFITAYEIGIKSELFGRKLRLNLSAFHYDISDYQVRSVALGQNLLLNAASVKADGIDLEFEAAPIDNLRLFGGLSWLNSRFSKFGGPGAQFQAPFLYPNPAICDNPATFDNDPGRVTGPPTGGILTCFGDATGNQTPLSPDLTASFGATLTVPVSERGELRMSGLLNYNSGYPFESDGLLRQKEFVLLNGSVEYRVTEHWGVELWGKNITNTKWFAQRAGTATGPFTTLSPPRQYGVTVKFDY